MPVRDSRRSSYTSEAPMRLFPLLHASDFVLPEEGRDRTESSDANRPVGPSSTTCHQCEAPPQRARKLSRSPRCQWGAAAMLKR
jgi:hypothetical protein